MNKKLTIILVLIAGLMFAASQFTVVGGKKESKNKDPLAAMIGKPAPEFSLQSQDGEEFILSQQLGKRVVLFFNEGIMCYPACWNQMATLGTDPKLNSEEVVAVSIVNDEAGDWAQAIKKMPELGKGKILLDTDKNVSQQYGMMYLPSSMHRGSLPGHTYIIVDREGIVRYTLDDPGMGIQNETLTKELEKI